MRYEIRPLGPWAVPVTRNRPYCRFRAGWPDTLDLLGRETDRLGARLVVLQVDVTEGEVRRDGMLRANARAGFPGVRVSFESRHGPLTYATDRYDRWQDNIRAVALSLEALRAVDRYGVSGSGEQYRGWTALEAEPHTGMSVEQAAEFVASHAGNGHVPAEVLADAVVRARAFRAAARVLPPMGEDWVGDFPLPLAVWSAPCSRPDPDPRLLAADGVSVWGWACSAAEYRDGSLPGSDDGDDGDGRQR